MLKKLLIALGLIVVLVALGVGAVFFFIDSIAKSAIEKGGTYALGTKTSVSSVSVGVFSGKFSMSGLEVANPAGPFESKHFLTLGTGATAVDYSTLKKPTVEIPVLTIDNLDANIETKGSATNYGAILENIKKVTGGDPAHPAPSDPNEKKFIIRQLTMTNLNIHVDVTGSMIPGPVGSVAGGVGKITKLNIPIDKIELKDVGQGQGGAADSGVSMKQLAAIIVKAVIAAAVDKGGGLMPAELLNDLTGKLSSIASLDTLSKGGAFIVGGAKGVVDTVGNIGGKVGEGVKNVTKGIGDGLKGLLPGQKPPENPPK